jgi:hypothetical protein
MVGINFNLRGIGPQLMAILKQEAQEQQLSVNSLILKKIEQSTGRAYEVARPRYHDLDSLGGTWTKSDVKDFAKSTAHFEKIDEDLWK